LFAQWPLPEEAWSMALFEMGKYKATSKKWQVCCCQVVVYAGDEEYITFIPREAWQAPILTMILASYICYHCHLPFSDEDDVAES
jgi:hypothetical protein